jgi:hypothetical protein
VMTNYAITVHPFPHWLRASTTRFGKPQNDVSDRNKSV